MAWSPGLLVVSLLITLQPSLFFCPDRSCQHFRFFVELGTSAQFMRMTDVVSERKKDSKGNGVSHGVEGHGQAEAGDVCVRRI